MKLSERLKADKEIFATLSRNDKILFAWDYYKIPILAVLCAVLLLTIGLVTGLKQQKIAMYAVFVNTAYLDVEPDGEALDALLEAGGMDMTGKTIDVTADLSLGLANNEEYDGQTIQILASLFGISGLDVFAADPAAFERYAVQDAFVDLSLFLEPELWEKAGCTPYSYENADGVTIVGGLVLPEGSVLHDAGYYYGDVVIGVAANAENLDAAILFVQQLVTAED